MSKRFAGLISITVILSLIAWTGAYAQDEGDSIEINDSGNISVDGQYTEDSNNTICNNIIGDIGVVNGQYAGGNLLDDEAAAAIAQENNTTIEIVQSCFEDIDSNNDDGNSDTETTTTEETTSTSRETEVLAETIPNKVLANTGGPSPLLPVSAALIGAGLLGFGILRRR